MTKPWKEFRQEIVRLYIQEGRTLRDVQEIMRRQHGFNASVRSYRQQFDHWGVGKYKCKRRPRRIDFAAVEAMPPPSPPATPTLPPITAPYAVAAPKAPLMAGMSVDPASMDYCWPAHRPATAAMPLETRQAHAHAHAQPGRSLSVSLPVGALASPHGQSRAYQTSRMSLPMMSTHDEAAEWAGRAAYTHGEPVGRDSTALYVSPTSRSVALADTHSCSHRMPTPAVTVRDPLSPVYIDNKTHMLGEVDWAVPRSAAYSLADADAAVYHGEQPVEARARPVHMYASSNPCALVAAKSSHLPLDRINVFSRGV
jgi:hypothetical protein